VQVAQADHQELPLQTHPRLMLRDRDMRCMQRRELLNLQNQITGQQQGDRVMRDRLDGHRTQRYGEPLTATRTSAVQPAVRMPERVQHGVRNLAPPQTVINLISDSEDN
jgi:hypothetical protein